MLFCTLGDGDFLAAENLLNPKVVSVEHKDDVLAVWVGRAVLLLLLSDRDVFTKEAIRQGSLVRRGEEDKV